MKSCFLALLCPLLLISPVHAGPSPRMVENVEPLPEIPGRASGLFHHNGIVLYSCEDATRGRELWKSDGTPAGTALIRDINPGNGDSSPSLFVAMGDKVCFIARDPMSGNQIWKTDKTAAGTVRVTDIPGGFRRDTEIKPAAAGGMLFYEVREETRTTLWKTDGTREGCAPVMQFTTGEGTEMTSLTSHGDEIYFILRSSSADSLWKSDGTTAGTVPVKSFGIMANPDKQPNSLISLNGRVYLAANDGSSDFGLWMTDGTGPGTILLKSRTASGNPNLATSPTFAAPFKGELFFRAMDANQNFALWKTDGTASGTVLVTGLATGGPAFPRDLTVAGDTLYFLGSTNTEGTELWKTDGTTAGSSMVKETTPGNIHPGPTGLAALGNEICFTASRNLWKSDGTAEGTVLVKQEASSGYEYDIPQPVGGGGSLLFVGPYGEISVTDGTPAGTGFLQGEYPYPESQPSPGDLTPVGDLLYFVRAKQLDRRNGYELWKSDGTPSGTVRVFTAPGFRSLIKMDGVLYFTTGTGDTNFQLYRTDGTEAGTIPVTSTFGGYPDVVGSRIYCRDADSFKVTDGTAEGTITVPMPSEWSNSHTSGFSAAGDRICFFASRFSANALWSTDGTAEGTRLLMDGYCGYVTAAAGGKRYFLQTQAASGTKIWSSDGTEDGTVPVATLEPSYFGYPLDMESATAVGNRLFFTMRHPVIGTELWVTDGTPGGTHLVKDICPGPGPSNIYSIREVGGMLYFRAEDGVHGSELWRSDGTPEGTTMVEDLFPGQGHGIVSYEITRGNDGIYFGGDDAAHGGELWRTDGTAGGGSMVADFTGDSGSSDPSDLVMVGTKLYFTALTNRYGRQLYVYDPAMSGAPAVLAGAPAELKRTSAVLTGSVRGNGLPTMVWVEYGETEDFGSSLPISPGPQGSSGFQDFSVSFGGLVQGRTYHYRYVAVNGAGLARTAPATFTVPVNRQPAAAGRSLYAYYQAPLVIPLASLLSGASDPDGDVLRIISTSGGSNGNTVAMDDEAVIFTPRTGFQGKDTISFAVIDDFGAMASADISIEVSGPFGFPSSFMGISGPECHRLDTGETFLLFTTIPGRQYHLQRSTDLKNWETIETVSGAEFIYWQDEHPPSGNAFYRLELP